MWNLHQKGPPEVVSQWERMGPPRKRGTSIGGLRSGGNYSPPGGKEECLEGKTQFTKKAREKKSQGRFPR